MTATAMPTTATPAPVKTAATSVLSWWRVGLTAGVPAAVGALLLLHPPEVYGVDGPFDPWYLVHVPVIVLTPLLAAAGWLLAGAGEAAAGRLARWSLFPFMVFYAGWEALAGLGSAWLVEATNALPPDARQAAVPLVHEWWAWINGGHWLAVLGMAAWAVFGVSAAVAHRRAGAPRSVVVGLGVASLYALLHGMVQGAIPLFAMAMVGWKLFRPARPVRPARAARPAPGA